MKKALLLPVFLSLSMAAISQFGVLARASYSQGIEQQYLESGLGYEVWSPGNGYAGELGAELEVFNTVSAYVTLGMNFNFAYYIAGTGGAGSWTSSINHSRYYMTIGGDKIFNFGHSDTFKGIVAGGGLNLNFSGSLTIQENGFTHGKIKYNPASGIHVDAKVRLELGDRFRIEPGLRVRVLDMLASSWEDGSTRDLPLNLQILDINGLEIGAVFYLGTD